MSKITLHRTGSFLVAPNAEDSTQCGFRRGDREVFFDVTIESDTEFLDENGFLIDNNAVQHYFSDTYKDATVFVSCERIACQAVEDLRALVDGDATHPRCYFVTVGIAPGTYAEIRVSQRFVCRAEGDEA